MTSHDDLDLQLRGWMRTRAANAAPARPDLVDRAMAHAATVGQRPRVLVRTGEGATTSWVPGTALRWALILGALLATLAAGVALVGSRPAGLARPVLVWATAGGFHLVQPDGVVQTGGAVGMPLWRDDPCPRAIPGTTLVGIAERFTGLQLMDVVGTAGTVRVTGFSDYAGTEYFAPRGPRFVQLELDSTGEQGATVVVTDLANPPATPSRRIAAPGVVGATVDETGRWLALATASEGGTALEVVDLQSGARRSVATVPRTIAASADPSTVLSIAPDGEHLALQVDPLDAPDVLVIVDAAGGRARPIAVPNGVALADLAWSPDGRWLALPQWDAVWVRTADGRDAATIDVPSPRNLAWSPDGSRLAFGRGGGGLATVAPDGSHLTSRPVLLGGFLWAADGTLVAARASDDGRDMVLEQYRADEVDPIARIGSFAIAGNEDPGDGFTVPRACLSWAAPEGGQ